MMASTSNISHPARPNPAYRTRAGRATLQGKPLDVVLERLRGYNVDVIYPTGAYPRAKRPAGHVLVFVRLDNVVEEVR